MGKFYFISFVMLCTWMLALVTGDICAYKECQCEEDVIECEDLNLKALPTPVVSKVLWQQYLTLNSNSITNITAAGLPGGLGGIDFEGNPITNVAQNAFVGSMNTLTTLKFSGANLDELPFALLFLNNLQHLSIKDSHIRQWDYSILYYLANTLKTLTLVNVGFTEWPQWIKSMSHLFLLEFSTAKVSVPDDAFQPSQNIFSITMKNVTLTSTANIFSKLVNLSDLILDDNKLSTISGLPNFGNLMTLSMSNNNISDATHLSNAMRPLAASLGTLYMNGNKLTSFPDLSFMTMLETIDFSYNYISTAGVGTVPASIKYLLLDRNLLTSLSSFIRGGKKLSVLRLGFNRIREFQGVDIPASVSDMDISHNFIAALTDNSFPQNSALGALRLDFNPISAISSSAFATLRSLTYLSLTNTKLTRLPVSLLNLKSLQTLDLSQNNYLVCTCQEKTLRAWSMSLRATISGSCGRAIIDYFLKILSVGCP